MHVCNPDNLCNRIKNPIKYSIIKAKELQNKPKIKKKEEKTNKNTSSEPKTAKKEANSTKTT